MLEGFLLCLALVAYHEGHKAEPIDGLFALTLTTWNRAQNDPAKVCTEVQRYKQFSWTLKPPPVVDDASWRTAQVVARLSVNMSDFTGGATHFHAIVCPTERAHECKPYWRSDMDVLGQWGNHIFYKEKAKR